MNWRRLCYLAGLLTLCVALPLSAGVAPAEEGTWILVDTRTMTLSVLQGDKVKRKYDNISIGRAGTARDKRRNDETTPLGRFHISRIARKSSFHRFFGIDYPSLENAERALAAGEISGQEYLQIRDAIRSHNTPPQDTSLGGYLGIHGVGAGDPAIHAELNWTNGCVALSNAQIDSLARWIRIGMPVVIK
ncbi:MAG: L,D-transpeptidase [Gammaproteobacteria bacterium]|jgi:L,D-peptidoglycan transpeptidase YkuD (ErfK/YbiS/YcfS/YnhG family)